MKTLKAEDLGTLPIGTPLTVIDGVFEGRTFLYQGMSLPKVGTSKFSDATIFASDPNDNNDTYTWFVWRFAAPNINLIKKQWRNK